MSEVTELATPVTTPNQSAASTRSAADRCMLKLLRIPATKKSVAAEQEAHRGFRVSMVVSGIRCLFTYLLVPILVPIIGFAGIVAAPVGILLCIIAAVNGVVSVRRFWLTDHRMKWMYTWFIVIVFVILAIALATDISRLIAA